MNESQSVKQPPVSSGAPVVETASTDRPGAESADDVDVELPSVASLFGILGAEHEYLPYDPDAVCREVLASINGAIHDADAEEMAELTKRSAGIEFPDLVVTRAEVALQDEYVTSDIVVLLHLMRAHAKSIEDGTVAARTAVPTEAWYTEPDVNRTFIMVRTLRVRTERAMKHLATAAQGVITRSKTHAKSLFNSNQQ